MKNAIQCPQCGTKIVGNFCSNCGFSNSGNLNNDAVQQWQAPNIKVRSRSSQKTIWLTMIITIVIIGVFLVPAVLSSGWFSNIIRIPGTRSNPIALGESGKYKDSLYKYRLELTMTGAARGDEAWELLKDTNTPLDDEKEYFVVKFKVIALSGSNNEKISISSSRNFEIVSQSGVSYEKFSVSGFSDIFPGGETEGYVYGIIDKEDTPIIGFEGSSVSDIMWFKITE